MKRVLPIVAAVALALLLLSPVASHACAVCFSGSQRLRAAFYNTTLFMTLLPLGMIGGGLLWLRRRGLFTGEFEDRDACAPGAPKAGASSTTCDESTPSSRHSA